jgi:carbonic anhydrase
VSNIHRLLENNRLWAQETVQNQPDYFDRLARIQNPEYLWIGCADSRVPANQITRLAPGEVFVHRNIANLVVHTDLNCLSVIQYAVEVLKVNDIIVTGHFGCGGIKAAYQQTKLGLIDNWLRHVQDVIDKYQESFSQIPTDEGKLRCICELNVVEQVQNVCRTTILQEAWGRGHNVRVHGLVYDLKDGLLKSLLFEDGMSCSSPKAFYQAGEHIIATYLK